MLMEVVPKMLAGRVVEMPLDLDGGSYFSGRKPQDGRIDWRLSAADIHNLVRAVAPPFPGAFFDIGLHRVEVLASYEVVIDNSSLESADPRTGTGQEGSE